MGEISDYIVDRMADGIYHSGYAKKRGFIKKGRLCPYCNEYYIGLEDHVKDKHGIDPKHILDAEDYL